jgi:hypothetical protein
MGRPAADQRRRDRTWIAALLGYGEFLIDAAVTVFVLRIIRGDVTATR